MSDEYTGLPNGNAQVEQLDAVEATNACRDLRPEKYNDALASVPEWQRKDNQPQRKLKHKEMARAEIYG